MQPCSNESEFFGVSHSSNDLSTKQKLYDIIFEADTPSGKAFDVLLLIAIIISILSLIFETVDAVHDDHKLLLFRLEWIITILFTIEYGLRLWCVEKPMTYAKSFFGIIDLGAILPAYLSLMFAGFQYLLIIRVLRLLRVFRVLKMVRYVGEAAVLGNALKASSRKIFVFVFVIINVVIIVGTLMYMIEGPEHGFNNIPTSMYWTIVTLTTVGYGDIAPETATGKLLASLLMVVGYGIIAVPTGIVTAELTKAGTHQVRLLNCPQCNCKDLDEDAVYCHACGICLDEG